MDFSQWRSARPTCHNQIVETLANREKYLAQSGYYSVIDNKSFCSLPWYYNLVGNRKAQFPELDNAAHSYREWNNAWVSLSTITMLWTIDGIFDGLNEISAFGNCSGINCAIFVSASHQTGLDTRPKTQRSDYSGGIEWGEGWARAEALSLLDLTGHWLT